MQIIQIIHISNVSALEYAAHEVYLSGLSDYYPMHEAFQLPTAHWRSMPVSLSPRLRCLVHCRYRFSPSSATINTAGPCTPVQHTTQDKTAHIWQVICSKLGRMQKPSHAAMQISQRDCSKAIIVVASVCAPFD